MRRLTHSPEAAYEYAPAWSSDGRRILFVRRDWVNTYLWVIDVDTTDEIQLTRSGNLQGDANPAWSPDGRRIAFERSTDVDPEHPRIYVMNADGSHARKRAG